MAEIVLRHEASAVGLARHLVIDSAGTAAVTGWGIDPTARRALERRGYEPHRHLARQFEAAWFPDRELVIALDQGHLRWLRGRAPELKYSERVELLLSYAAAPAQAPAALDVPDPYLGDEADFESCLDLVQAACLGLLARLEIELAR